ncbi:hypothetical protein [Pontiella agarivorans]|uniref:Uncharacterized protein n=1 Tax=Pontiella agarivorans TaxID=3038953 RepID=A0ABU5MXE5_9BACT|nr:hypothetical protein [Pontiella agarivorans]MDZ8118832.1 hypothetical protein [Pontiella agarivorans]
MNKSVQILLALALFPLVVNARKETLEERKQRIVRKYLRENAAITQSDMVVPSEMEEDERVLDSEKLKEVKDNSLQREDVSGKPFIPPPPQPRPVPRENANWLFGDAEEEVTEFDMYGNPVDSSVDNDDSLWSWDRAEKEKPERRRETYSRSDGRGDGSVRDSKSSGAGAWGQPDRNSSIFQTDSALFGRSRNMDRGGSGTDFGLQGKSRRTYGSDPEEGLLSPFPQYRSSGETKSSGFGTPSQQAHQPYKSTYEQEREQRQKQWNGLNQNLEKQEDQFKRTDSYKQWKDRNKSYDPLSDDAYLNPQKR